MGGRWGEVRVGSQGLFGGPGKNIWEKEIWYSRLILLNKCKKVKTIVETADAPNESDYKSPYVCTHVWNVKRSAISRHFKVGVQIIVT